MAGPSMVLPGGSLEICFSFDTTYSMTSYVNQVKARLQDMVQRLKSDVPGIRISLFAHGDYYQPDFDNKSPYVTRHVDFTDSVPKLCKFIKEAVPTEGGDWQECYELVMKEAREMLSWSAKTNKVLVLIGDARPHPPGDYVYMDYKGIAIDWKEEAKKLLDSKIRCYGVYCNTPKSAQTDKDFFSTLSTMGQGSFLELKNFDSIFDFMMAICYREHGEDALFAYEAEVRGRSGGAAKDVHHMLTTLKKSVSNASTEGVTKPTKLAVVATKQPSKTVAGKGKKTKPPGTTRTTVRIVGKAAGRAVKPKTTSTKTAPKTKGKTVAKPEPAPAPKALSKTAKNKKTGIERMSKYKSKAKILQLQKLRRERVPETNFALREFPWSPWKILMSSEARKGLMQLLNILGKNVIYSRGLKMFKGKANQLALYELAVKPIGCRLKKVVYAKICPDLSSFSKLLKAFPVKGLRKQINNIIVKQGGDIYVRRLVLRNYPKYKQVPSIVKNYDYAWVPEAGAKKYREVMKDSYVISEEMGVD